MIDEYEAFLASKAISAPMRGIRDVPPLSSHLRKFQNDCVDFGLQAGSSGCFLDTGLGKTMIELEWSTHAAAASNGKGLILVPLAVARQTEAEGKKYGYEARVIRNQEEAYDGINICNYDRLELLDPSVFGSIVLDESSILKNFTGKTTRALIDAFSRHQWRLPSAGSLQSDAQKFSPFFRFGTERSIRRYAHGLR